MTHVGQLVNVVQYCYNGKPYERLLTFLLTENHSSMTLFKSWVNITFHLKISVTSHASNMKCLKKGLQTLFKNFIRYADYVPVQSIPCWEKQYLLSLKLLTILEFCKSCIVYFLFWISTKMRDFQHTEQSKFFSKELKCN